MALVIVESPNKIKKIGSILGKEYTISASVGHIMDLNPKCISIDVANNFEPIYVINSDKHSVVKTLKDLHKKCTEVLIATDKDREGEMIAWSIAKVLNIDIDKAKRITFSEITKTAIEKAINEAKKIDMNMVNAQKARREMDRFIGYEISPILQKTIRAESAGRVQSIVVKIILEREKEIRSFYTGATHSSYTFRGKFYDKNNNIFTATMGYRNPKDKIELDMEVNADNDNTETSAKLSNIEDARKLMTVLCNAKYSVQDIINKESISKPAPPFTTSTLQQEASSKMGMKPKRTMIAAQHLYESGMITYMRTDSVALSDEINTNIKNYVVSKYGNEYYRYSKYSAKNNNTQEAHEAIRPTDITIDNIKEDNRQKIKSDEIKLYNLIWRRTVGSQMQPAKYDIENIIIINDKNSYYFTAQNKVIKFLGYMVVYNKSEDKQKIEMPPKKSQIKRNDITCTQEYNRPPSRYTEASLIKRLDPSELNIGRPSTYATIMNVIQENGYVETKDIEGKDMNSITIECKENGETKESNNIIKLGKEGSKLVPTQMGESVSEFMEKYFPKIMEYKFTINMEKDLDDIANGEKLWWKVVEKFYNEIHPIVIELNTKLNTLKEDNAQAHIIGKHTVLNRDIIAEMGKYGAYIKMMNDNNKYIMAPLREPHTYDNISIEDAVKLLEYPKMLGKNGRKHVILKNSKNGLYITCGDDSVNIPADYKKTEILLEDAIELLNEKRKNIHFEGKDDKTKYVVKTGPYGLYVNVKCGTESKNYKLPADTVIADITVDKIKELMIKPKTGYKKFTKFKKNINIKKN